jgi:carbonic anhydrase
VASRLVDGEIQLHGWYYDIGTGGVFAFDAETGEWNELNAVEEPAEVETVEV